MNWLTGRHSLGVALDIIATRVYAQRLIKLAHRMMRPLGVAKMAMAFFGPADAMSSYSFVNTACAQYPVRQERVC